MDYNTFCSLASIVKNKGDKIFEGASTVYELKGVAKLLIEDAGYSETLTFSNGNQFYCVHDGKEIVKLFNNKTDYVVDLSSKLKKDEELTEEMLKNLVGSDIEDKIIFQYTGKLSYIRELLSHIACEKVKNKKGEK